MNPVNVKQLQRESRRLRVQPLGKGRMAVSSATNPNKAYVVTYAFGKDGKTVYANCTCEWGKHHGIGCSHIMAALEYLAHRKGRTLSFWPDEQAALRQNHRRFYLTSRARRNNGLWITSRKAS